jgi:hypothetical protein
LDFCAVAWSAHADTDYRELASDLRLNQFRIGQLIGQSAEFDETDNDHLLTEGVCHLVSRERDAVHAALVEGFGDVPELFLSLWKTSLPIFRESGMTIDDYRLETSRAEILYEVTPEKLTAYEWLDQGYPYR